MMKLAGILIATLAAITDARFSEYKVMEGHTVKSNIYSPLPHTYIDAEKLPQDFTWQDVDGVNYLTKNLNQHLPQYCGSCWAHGAMSSLADRIKIARKAKYPEINLAVQFILNCGTETAGSCYGGDHSAAFEFVQRNGFVPYDTCLPYEACSHDSKEGNCGQGNYECSAINTCRTCSTFKQFGGFCSELNHFPNATIAEHGRVSKESHIMAEVFARGPIACGVDANALDEYTGGIIDNDKDKQINHVVSIVGWGVEKSTGVKYWIVRNSWGEYWGEMGFFRVVRGKNQLSLEAECAWATPGRWTEHNYPCYEDGSNCVTTKYYKDPHFTYKDPHFTHPKIVLHE